MAESIHRFLFSSRDVFKAIRHRYLILILNPESFPTNQLVISGMPNSDSASIGSNSLAELTSRSLLEEIVSLNDTECNKQRKYKKFVQRLSIKMKHSTITEEVNTEYDFVVSMVENVARSTDMLRKLQESVGNATESNFNGELTGDVNKKSVKWRDSHDTTIRNQMSKYYLDRYWYQVDSYLDVIDSVFSGRDCIKSTYDNEVSSMSKLGSPHIHNPRIKVALSNLMKEPLLMKNFPSELRPCLFNQSLKMQLSARLSLCDSALCRALGYGHDDRFFAGQKCSNTCREFLRILNTLKSELEDLNLEENPTYFLPVIQKCFQFLLVTSNAIILRTRLKFQKILSSWNISSFIFFMFADTNMLINAVSNIFTVTKVISDSRKARGVYSVLRTDFQLIKTDLETLQKIYGDMNEALKNKVRLSTLSCIYDGFPEDTFWQKKKADPGEVLSTIQFSPNEYVKSILLYNISPIASSLSFLEIECEKKAIGVVIEIVLSTLISYVSEKKIKLSFVGACQLEADICHIKSWMEGYFSVDVFGHVSNLSILKDISMILDILKRQHNFDSDNTRNSSKNRTNLRICSNYKAVKTQENSLNKILESPLPSNGESVSRILNEWSKLRAHPLDSNVITFHSCM